MNEVPEWSRSPESATHWTPETDDYHQCWYRKFDGFWEFIRIGSDMKDFKRCPDQPNRALLDRMVARNGTN